MNVLNVFVLPYRLARTPLVVLDSNVGSRLPEDSRPRLVLDWTLGTYDKIAGRLLSNPSLSHEGSARLEKVRKLAKSAELDRKATERREAAAMIAAAGHQKASEKAEQAQSRALDGLRDAETAERRGKQAAATAARETAARKKAKVDADTAQRVAGIENKAKRTMTAADARAAAAREEASAKLRDAAERRSDADSKRDDAEQLSALTEAKRESRATKS